MTDLTSEELLSNLVGTLTELQPALVGWGEGALMGLRSSIVGFK